MASARKVLADVLDGTKPVRTNLDGSAVERDRDYAAEEAGRSKVLLQVRVRPEVKERAAFDAARHDLDTSAYVAALITGQPLPPPPTLGPGSDALLLTLAGNRVMQAIAGVQARIGRGEGDLAELLPVLREIQRAIAAGHLSLRADYEAALDAQHQARDDRWDDNDTPELPRKREHRGQP